MKNKNKCIITIEHPSNPRSKGVLCKSLLSRSLCAPGPDRVGWVPLTRQAQRGNPVGLFPAVITDPRIPWEREHRYSGHCFGFAGRRAPSHSGPCRDDQRLGQKNGSQPQRAKVLVVSTMSAPLLVTCDLKDLLE